MEIIKKGKLPEEEEFQDTCDYCRTVFKYKRAEARETSDQREGNFLTVGCPLCKKPVIRSLRTNTGYWDR